MGGNCLIRLEIRFYVLDYNISHEILTVWQMIACEMFYDSDQFKYGINLSVNGSKIILEKNHFGNLVKYAYVNLVNRPLK